MEDGAIAVKEASGGLEGSKFSVSFPSIQMNPVHSFKYVS